MKEIWQYNYSFSLRFHQNYLSAYEPMLLQKKLSKNPKLYWILEEKEKKVKFYVLIIL